MTRKDWYLGCAAVAIGTAAIFALGLGWRHAEAVATLRDRYDVLDGRIRALESISALRSAEPSPDRGGPGVGQRVDDLARLGRRVEQLESGHAELASAVRGAGAHARADLLAPRGYAEFLARFRLTNAQVADLTPIFAMTE